LQEHLSRLHFWRAGIFGAYFGRAGFSVSLLNCRAMALMRPDSNGSALSVRSRLAGRIVVGSAKND
jgi:hypothetical protein